MSNSPRQTPNRSEKEIFFEALELDSADERDAFLQGACGQDPILKNRVLELLARHFEKDSFMEGSAVENTRPPTSSPLFSQDLEEGPGTVIGPYKILQKIGEGGFGMVYMAEQKTPIKRRIALKVIKVGMDTKQVVARFEAERQALALMDHPNVAKVLDGGATNKGRPYFAMELVRGISITEYCDQNQLNTRERLELFTQVCQAIQHAHQKGIIHRDLKPSNILVTLHDGTPVPKVIDFGIAKATQGDLTDKTVFTQFQQFIGTPAYISPEQSEMSGLDIDTRSDIYSLGVLLYELLVGRTPFDAREMVKDGIESLRQIIREKDPVKPSTKLRTLEALDLTTTAQRRRTDGPKLTHLLRGDLDWIVMKCLEKDRNRRYETANALAMDIRRSLANEPIVARPPSALYLVQKLIRRNKTMFAALVLTLSVLSIAVSTVIVIQYQANQDYRQRLYVSEIGRAGLALEAGRSMEASGLLDKCPVEFRNWEWNFLHEQVNRWQSSTFMEVENLSKARISHDDSMVIAATEEGIHVRSFPEGQWLCSIPIESYWHTSVTPSPREPLLATMNGMTGEIGIWHLNSGKLKTNIHHGGPARGLAWSADGQSIASGGNYGLIRVWNPDDGTEHTQFEVDHSIQSLAFSPDNEILAVGTSEGDIWLLNTTDGKLLKKFRSQGQMVWRLKFSPDGRKLAASNRTYGGFSRDNRVWSLDEEEGSLDLNTGSGSLDFHFSEDSRYLYIADNSGNILFWDLQLRAELERLSADFMGANMVHQLVDGRIISAGNTGKIKIWTKHGEPIRHLQGYDNSLRTIAFSPDSQWLVAGGLSKKVMAWNLKQGFREISYGNHTDYAGAVAFSPGGKVASASAIGEIHLWDPETLKTDWEIILDELSGIWWLAFSPDGERLYAGHNQEAVSILNAETGVTVNTITGLEDVVDGLAVSPDNNLIAVCHKVKLSVWTSDGTREVWQAPGNPDRCAAFSPDSQWIATGDNDGKVSLWNVEAKGQVRRQLSGHTAVVRGVAFSPDGTRLVSSDDNGQIKLWDWRAGQELLNLSLPLGAPAWHVAFSPDGLSIVAAGGDGIVTVWKTE